MPFIFDHLVLGTGSSDILDDGSFQTSDIVWIKGYAGADAITSNGYANRVDGGRGNDTIYSNGGFIFGGDGDDIITGTGAFERVHDGAGSDIIDLAANGFIAARGDGGNIYQGSLDPADISETVSYSRGPYGVTLWFLDDGNATAEYANTSDALIGIDRIITGSGNDQVLGHGASFLELRTRSGDDYIDVDVDTAIIHAGAGNDTVVLTGRDVEAEISVGTGIDRIFCGIGQETIAFRTGGEDRTEKAFTYVFDFESGPDKIKLQSRLSVSDFMALARDDTVSGISGVRFDAASGNTLFVVGFTADQLTADDFIL